MPPRATVSVLALVCLWCVEECVCFSNGLVASACDNLMPGHHPYTPSTTTPPYALSASSTTYRPGGVITVTLEVVGKSSFMGFLLQARSRDGPGSVVWPVGMFTNINSTLFTGLDCGGMKNSAVSQASSKRKTKVQMMWEAPGNSSYGEIYFSATLVQDYTTFWVQVNSSTLSLDRPGNTAAEVFSSLTGMFTALLLQFACD